MSGRVVGSRSATLASLVALALAVAALAPTPAPAQSAAVRRVAVAPRLAWSSHSANASLVQNLALGLAHADAPPVAARAAMRVALPSARAETGRSAAARQAFRAVLGVGVGAVVGGWLGYFTSQVGRSDWDQLPSAEKRALRQDYTRIGVGVGSVAGYFLRPRSRAPIGLPQPAGMRPRTGRLLVQSAELRRTLGANVLEAVEFERPEWTRQLRADRARAGASASTGAVEVSSVVVYVGDERVGALETLEEISIPEVAELRYYDSRDAKRRWGVDHRYGAIEIVPAGSAAATDTTQASMALPAAAR